MSGCKVADGVGVMLVWHDILSSYAFVNTKNAIWCINVFCETTHRKKN